MIVEDFSGDIAVVFDMDGVIVDNHDFHCEAWLRFCENHNIPQTREDFNQHFGGTNREVLKLMFGEQISNDRINQLSEEKESIYRTLYSDHIKTVKGLEEFLKTLKLNNIPSAIATSAPIKNVEFVLEQTGLVEYFNTIIHEGLVYKSKPDPEVFLKAAFALHMEPSDCIAIEDSVRGIRSAKSAGMRVIALTTTNTSEKLTEADLVINNFTQLNMAVINQIMERV
ncbi:MAG: HAD family phosphatase [Bacteroidales bacterium]|nr:HAD family phosphatase [Bacteroidales bacterium]